MKQLDPRTKAAYEFLRKFKDSSIEDVAVLIEKYAGIQLADFFETYSQFILDSDPDIHLSGGTSLMLLGFMIGKMESENELQTDGTMLN